MNYQQYCAYNNAKLNRAKFKNWLIAILTAVIVLLLGVIVNLKRAYSLREYSIANNCTWVWMGTATGTDQDYVCK